MQFITLTLGIALLVSGSVHRDLITKTSHDTNLFKTNPVFQLTAKNNTMQKDITAAESSWGFQFIRVNISTINNPSKQQLAFD